MKPKKGNPSTLAILRPGRDTGQADKAASMLKGNSSSFDFDDSPDPSSSKPQQAVKIHKLKISNENIKE